jgi:uncharacterized protein DUF3846
MTDTPIDLVAVTPHGGVWDYSVGPNDAGRVTTEAVLGMLHELINCSAVDVVRLAPEIDMWVDDEGALKPRLRVNQLASYIATRFGFPFQLYIGVVVFTGGPDADGNTTSLSKPAREAIEFLINELRSIPGS